MIETIHSDILGDDCLKYVHPCGVTVLMYPMRGVSSVTAQFSVRFGAEDSVFRAADGSMVTVPDGTAHYLEHKLFESEEKDAFALFAQTGASCNAGTSYDSTVYYFSCADNFTQSLEILLGFVQQPYFTPENVEKERGIITQEINMYRDSPNWRVLTELLGGVYSVNPIKNDIAGTPQSIALITDKLLYEVYDAFYNPSNMYLCVAGNFDPEDVVKVCDRCLKERPRREIAAPRPSEPREVAKKRVEISMPVAKPQFAIGFKRPDADGQEALDEYTYYSVLFYIIFGEISGFYMRMRDSGAVNDTFRPGVFQGRGYVMPYAVGESGDPDLVLEKMKEEIRFFKLNPPSREEFGRVKKSSYGSCVRYFGNAENAAQTLTDAALMGLSPFSLIETMARADYDGLLKRLSELDEENVCLSVVMPAGGKDFR